MKGTHCVMKGTHCVMKGASRLVVSKGLHERYTPVMNRAPRLVL